MVRGAAHILEAAESHIIILFSEHQQQQHQEKQLPEVRLMRHCFIFLS
jgi:hypothetical protein